MTPQAWMKPYLSGQTSYVEENWSEMVQAMEESLQLYLKLVLTYAQVSYLPHIFLQGRRRLSTTM